MAPVNTAVDKIPLTSSTVVDVPFQRREPQPGLTADLDRIAALDTELRAWDAHRRLLIDQRAQAIRDALAHGGTLAKIGDLLGVSAVRARQMRDGK